MDELDPFGESSVEREHKKESRSQVVRLVVLALLGVALILFVVQNTQTVQLHWLTFTFETQQWILILVVAAIAVGLTNVGGHLLRRRKRRAREAKEAAERD